MAEWRQLAAVAALVRFAEDPQWLAVEWAEGTPATTYVTPARDALLAALVDAAQTNAGRPIPVLCQPTAAGEPIVALRAQAVAAPVVTPGGMRRRASRSAPVCAALRTSSTPLTESFLPPAFQPQMLSWKSSACTS